jgi:hypothetical protein
MKGRLTTLTLIVSLTGCASWCDNSEDRNKCLTRVHVAQAVGAGLLVAGAAVAAVHAARNGSGSDNSYGGNSYAGRQYTGNCQYDWQVAADGSRCGARSAESRPGGF